MFLEMNLNGLPIDRQIVNFGYSLTVDERERHLKFMANVMQNKHAKKIKQANIKPVFYIDRVGSKMNFLTVEM